MSFGAVDGKVGATISLNEICQTDDFMQIGDLSSIDIEAR
jgi:hypothetical protein